MDRLNLINIFVAVVDANGFAGAARKLNVSPPAVTRAINELEGHLGVRLLTRTTRAVRVTDTGTRYAEDSRRILADIAEADESISGLHGAPRGRLTLTAPVLFGARFVTPIVTEYLRRYPEVHAACWFLGRLVNMEDEGVDVAVRIAAADEALPSAIRVGQVRRVIVASPDYLARCGIPVVPQDLQAHRIVAVQPTAQASEWRLIGNGAPLVFKPQARLCTNGNESAIAAAVGGFGITQVLSYQVADHLREGRLKVVLSEFEPAPLAVTVRQRGDSKASPKARAFIDLAVECLRANPALN